MSDTPEPKLQRDIMFDGLRLSPARIDTPDGRSYPGVRFHFSSAQEGVADAEPVILMLDGERGAVHLRLALRDALNTALNQLAQAPIERRKRKPIHKGRITR